MTNQPDTKPKKPVPQYLCPSYNDDGVVKDCKCGKCWLPPKAPPKLNAEPKDLNTLDDFLYTLKVHNKDLDACFNDALAVRHLNDLITSLITRERLEARIDELDRVYDATGLIDDTGYSQFLKVAYYNRIKELESQLEKGVR